MTGKRGLLGKTGETITTAARKGGDKIAAAAKAGAAEPVPGPSPNPATNLIIHDLALRSAGRVLRHSVEKGLLGRRYTKSFARDVVGNRSILHTLIATGATKLATRSLPGAAVVWGGLIAKTLYDRRQGKKAAKRAGTRQLAKQADPDTLL